LYNTINMKRVTVYTICLLLLAVCMLFITCRPQDIGSFQREDHFSLDIGPMEDQIALYDIENNAAGIMQAEIAMRDGFFFISDRNSGKIVRYNSYGELLFMIYNNEINPEPISLRVRADNGAQATRWAYIYPMLSPGKIAVDSRKHIYTEERLPLERHGFDEENRALLSSVILHFDEDGRFIEYLGQGGQGGGPLPLITGLYTSAEDEIAVVCRLSTGWDTYWYSADGEQLFLIQIRNNTIPVPAEWSNHSASVDAIMAAPDARKLFIKVDYYRNVYDESTRLRVSTEPANSLVWILNVEDGMYEKYLEVPLYEHSISEKGSTTTIRLFYSMLGLTQEGGFILYFPVESGYTILRMNINEHGQRRGVINVSPDELQFNSFHLSPEGILSALLADNWTVKVAWWRLDRFL